jgi:hypothetical protein
LNRKYDSIFDEKNFSKNKETAALVGSSTCFGIGASSDTSTISSKLSELSNFHFFNLGGRAFSGFQEIILFQALIRHLKDIKKIVIFSGINDILLTNRLSMYDPILGPYYFNNQYIRGMTKNTLNWKRSLTRFLLDPFIKNNVDWNLITKKELFDHVFKKKPYGKTEPLNKDEILRTLIERNFSCWSNIQKAMKIKIIYVLQPMAHWNNKELSYEEEKIFKYLDSSNKDFQTIKLLDLKKYKYYKECIAENCSRLNFDFIDSNDYISKKNLHKKWIFVDRAHLTDLGNKYIAELILSNL